MLSLMRTSVLHLLQKEGEYSRPSYYGDGRDLPMLWMAIERPDLLADTDRTRRLSAIRPILQTRV